MKTAELKELGLSDEQIAQVFAINGKDIESAKAAKDKTIADLTAERDNLKAQLDTAETTLKGFEGIDPEKMQQEIQSYIILLFSPYRFIIKAAGVRLPARLCLTG